MSFKEDILNFQDFDDSDVIYTYIPQGVITALKGLLIKDAHSANRLKSLCYDLASRIPTQAPRNWGRDFLVNDFYDLLDRLSDKLPKFMDFLLDFTIKEYSPNNFVNELHEIFEENNFGYRLEEKKHPMGHLVYYWEIYKEPGIVTKTIDAAQEEINTCEQALSHLKQARKQLLNSVNDDRARKDAVRDSLSAMEALIKDLGRGDNIEKSIKNLRQRNVWGPDIILNEGLSIWNQMHKSFPDIRHGNPICSSLTQPEALYWIDRLMAYISYIARKNKEINL
jgi:hypothetical protein